MSTLAHFPLEPSYEDYSFWDQTKADFEHGLASILIDSINTAELDVSLDETYIILSSVSSSFIHLDSTVSDTSNQQLAPSIKSCMLWHWARAPLLPVLQAGRTSASKLIWYFSSYPNSILILSFFAFR